MRAFIIIAILTSFILQSSAQVQPAAFRGVPGKKFNHSPVKPGNSDNARTTQCGQDTVYYGYGKATSLRGLNINTVSSADKVCQWFDAPQPMMLHGFTFFAWQSFGTTDTVTLTCSAVIAGSDSLPTTAVAGSGLVKVDTTFGSGNLAVLEKTVMFSSPVLVNLPYVLMIETSSPVAVSVVANDWDSLDGGSEWLGSANIPSAGWLHGYEVNVGSSLFDADFLFQPIVTYDIDASFVADTNCLPAGGTVVFDNRSSAILNSRFYNQYIFSGTDSLVYTWDYGDGSPLGFVQDAIHAFGSGVNYETILTANMVGWSVVCAESQTTVINPHTQSGFSYVVNGLNAAFTNESEHYDSCYWNFGDGDTSTAANPLHAFAPMTSYDVTLICYGQCNNDTLTRTVTFCDQVSSDFNYTTSGSAASFSVASLTGSASFSWNFGDGSNGSGIAVSHTYSSNGTYNVCLIASNSCMSDTTCRQVQITSTGAGFPYERSRVSIYPNPVNERVTIHFGDQGAKPIRISLSDHVGRVVKAINVFDSEYGQIGVNELPAGIYVMKIEMMKEIILRKIVIAR